MQRRKFIQNMSALGAGLLCGGYPDESWAGAQTRQLSILHTNDVHSRLDPFPMDGSKYQGQGGVLARERIIRNIRAEREHVLLLDAGDIFQGTPYFNFYKGEPEMKVMSMLGYDAATLGNHDFDNGIDGLVKQMSHADFPFVNCNYRFDATALENLVKPYSIIRKGGLKIGILGVGIELKGLVPNNLCDGVLYEDPLMHANRVAYHLKKNKKCDYVICLSHLGFEYKDGKISDKILAAESEYIDCILGGHTHTFLEEPHKVKNRQNQAVIVNQAGWAGLRLGRIDIFFDNKNDSHYVSNFTVVETYQTRV
jgi:5'-nucleotidase